MSTEQALMQRSNSSCELCTASNNLSVYSIPPESSDEADRCVLLCETCRNQVAQPDTMETNHWRCLNESMWSQIPAVQVMTWRQLSRLSQESWAQDLLDMLYLDDEIMAWAKSDEPDNNDDSEATLDSNGTVLTAGDTVTLIKDLLVKGAGFTAKRGTAVRNISLTPDPSQIEGRVNGTRIVLLTQYLKKSN